MTNLEALSASTGYPMSGQQLEKCLLDHSLVSTADYAKSENFDLALMDALLVLLSTPNISQGGYSLSLGDVQVIERRIKAIASEYGIQDPITPKIRDKSNVW